MKVYLDGEEHQLPDVAPTPRVIYKYGKCYLLREDWHYNSVAFMITGTQSEVLHNRQGEAEYAKKFI